MLTAKKLHFISAKNDIFLLALTVRKLDRLARRPLDAYWLIEQLKKKRVDLICTDENLPLTCSLLAFEIKKASVLTASFKYYKNTRHERKDHMELTAKQYEIAVNNAAEISQVFLDMEGGKFVLAMFSELVRELLNEGNTAAAVLAVRKLHETAEVPLELDTLAENSTTAWILLFAEAMWDTESTF